VYTPVYIRLYTDLYTVYTMTDQTMIRIAKATRDKLNRLGERGETYDDIINRVVFKQIKAKKETGK